MSVSEPADPNLGFHAPDDEWISRLKEALSTPPPGRVGPYDQVEEVHRGGQGVVFRARQPGTHRPVALKRLLGGGLATSSMRARFEREISILASLRHKNIVTVYGLEMVDGQPLLAMEWIDGVPITEWCERGAGGERRSPKEIVELFVQVCEGVRDAHRHGIVHRDLKPSNILVDADGVPHVLDFGLAKRLEGNEANLTLTTEFLGTPAYAAPEQVTGTPPRPDARADVYSLGVLLYECLSGHLPYKAEGSVESWIHAIADGEPPRPSSLNPAVDAEIETVVSKAMARDREIRYSSVDDLSADLRRHLAGEAIVARRPSTWSRLRRAVRKHRSAALLGLVVLGATAGFGVYALSQQKLLDSARADASKQREAFESLLRFVTENQFIVEQSGDLSDRALPLRQIPDVRDMAPKLLADRPVDLARYYCMSSVLLRDHGRGREALEDARHALRVSQPLGPQAEWLRARAHLAAAQALSDLDRDREARDDAAHAARIARSLPRAERSTLVSALAVQATSEIHLCRFAEVHHLLREAEIAVDENPTREGCLEVLYAHASLASARNDDREAKEKLLEASDLCVRESLADAAIAEQLGGAHLRLRELADAERELERARRVREKLQGERGPMPARIYTKLGELALARQDTFAAEKWYLRAKSAIEGEGLSLSAASLGWRNGMSEILRRRGDAAGAVEYSRETVRQCAELFGEDHPAMITFLGNLAERISVLHYSTSVGWTTPSDEAGRLFESALSLARRLHRGDHMDVAFCLNGLAQHRKMQGEHSMGSGATEQAGAQFREAISLYRESDAMTERLMGRDHPARVVVLTNCAHALMTESFRCNPMQGGRNESAYEESKKLILEAAAAAHEAIRVARAVLQPDDLDLGLAMLAAGKVDSVLDRAESAQAELQAARTVLQKIGPTQRVAANQALQWLAMSDARRGDLDSAHRRALEAEAELQSIVPADTALNFQELWLFLVKVCIELDREDEVADYAGRLGLSAEQVQALRAQVAQTRARLQRASSAPVGDK